MFPLLPRMKSKVQGAPLLHLEQASPSPPSHPMYGRYHSNRIQIHDLTVLTAPAIRYIYTCCISHAGTRPQPPHRVSSRSPVSVSRATSLVSRLPHILTSCFRFSTSVSAYRRWKRKQPRRSDAVNLAIPPVEPYEGWGTRIVGILFPSNASRGSENRHDFCLPPRTLLIAHPSTSFSHSHPPSAALIPGWIASVILP